MNYPWIFEELAQKPGAVRDFKEEWQWTRFQVGGKLFAAICKDGAGNDALLTLKLPPEENCFLREQYEDILPGYYCNKAGRQRAGPPGAGADGNLLPAGAGRTLPEKAAGNLGGIEFSRITGALGYKTSCEPHLKRRATR